MSRRISGLIVPILALCALQGCLDIDMTGLEDALGSGYGDGGYGDGGFGGFCQGTKGTPSFAQLRPTAYESHLQLGDSIDVKAIVVDGACSEMAVALTGAWSVSPPTVATVESFGVLDDSARVRARALGNATVHLRKDSLEASITFTVVPRMATFVLDPASATIKVGDSVWVSTTATDTAGRVWGELPIAWTFANAGAAIMNFQQQGLWIIGIQPGKLTATARLFAMTRSSVITVIAR